MTKTRRGRAALTRPQDLLVFGRLAGEFPGGAYAGGAVEAVGDGVVQTRTGQRHRLGDLPFLAQVLERLRGVLGRLLHEVGLRLVTLAENYGIPADETTADAEWIQLACEKPGSFIYAVHSNRIEQLTISGN